MPVVTVVMKVMLIITVKYVMIMKTDVLIIQNEVKSAMLIEMLCIANGVMI